MSDPIRGKRGRGYQPLEHDVRDLVVPLKWRGWEYEYRHGYGMGLLRDGVNNPVSHRADLLAIEYDNASPRDAWFAGYKAGTAFRRSLTVGTITPTQP